MKTLILSVSRNDTYTGGWVTGMVAAMTSPGFGGWLKMEHESDIARGRSKLLCKALETDFENYLWIDDDIVWTREHFDAINAVPVDCIGGVYVKRHALNREVWNDDLGDHAPGHPNVIRVREVGTGFLRVTRRAVELLKGKVPEAPASGFTHYFNAGVTPDGQYLSEDYAFCAALRAAAVPIWLHRGIKLGHIGTQIYRPQ